MIERQRDTPRLMSSSAQSRPAEGEHATPAATDVSQARALLLRRPAALEAAAGPQPARLTPPSALKPVLQTDASAVERAAPDPRAEAIAAHLTDAHRFRKEAEGFLNNLQATATLAAAASARWLDLVHVVDRTADQNQAYKQLEEQILDYSRRLASLRQRWSTCMAQAREHEESARVLQESATR